MWHPNPKPPVAKVWSNGEMSFVWYANGEVHYHFYEGKWYCGGIIEGNKANAIIKKWEKNHTL
jgi:hypothetical protein